MTFWIIVALMALAVAALLALALLRGRSLQEPAAAYDLRVYRDQLAGVDKDLARGVIDTADAERIRTEISRRILAADTQVKAEESAGSRAGRMNLSVAIVFGVALIVGSLGLYRSLGAPGYGDLPLSLRIEMAEANRTSRPAQAEVEARMPPAPKPQIDENYARLLEQLRSTVAERPDDIQGHALLAQHEANTGDLVAAYKAKARVIELLQDEASARDYTEQAEMMVMAAGGYVSPEAEAALSIALKLDPGHGPARYYWGQFLNQVGRPDLAFQLWEQTLAQSAPDAPWAAAIREQIANIAFRAGVEYEAPAESAPTVSGPSAEDMQAASEMTAEERQEMIRGMVSRLSDRLATDGGSPEEWARLIGALGVLGETERAQAILDEARQDYADNPQALELVNEAAARTGLN